MNKEELLEIETSFNEKVKDETDSKEIVGLFERFYNWLVDKLSEEKETELQADLTDTFNRLLYTMTSTLTRRSIICKKLSSNWNASLVKRTYELCNGKTQALVKELLKDLLDEKDFPTKAYCYQVLQQNGVVDFSKVVVDRKKISSTPRKGYSDSNPIIYDDGRRYWHTVAKELMTYDECTEKGFDHRFLAFPMGSDSQGCYVGFDEPDNRPIPKCTNEEVIKLVEEIYTD